jgi:hypothetical protein
MPLSLSIYLRVVSTRYGLEKEEEFQRPAAALAAGRIS